MYNRSSKIYIFQGGKFGNVSEPLRHSQRVLLISCRHFILVYDAYDALIDIYIIFFIISVRGERQ